MGGAIELRMCSPLCLERHVRETFSFPCVEFQFQFQFLGEFLVFLNRLLKKHWDPVFVELNRFCEHLIAGGHHGFRTDRTSRHGGIARYVAFNVGQQLQTAVLGAYRF